MRSSSLTASVACMLLHATALPLVCFSYLRSRRTGLMNMVCAMVHARSSRSPALTASTPCCWHAIMVAIIFDSSMWSVSPGCPTGANPKEPQKPGLPASEISAQSHLRNQGGLGCLCNKSDYLVASRTLRLLCGRSLETGYCACPTSCTSGTC